MALLRLILGMLFYILAILSGCAKRLFNRIGNDAIDIGDYVSAGGDPDEVRVRTIAERWKRDNDSME